MRRVLIALAIVGAFAFSASPAVAQEGDGSTETVTPSQTSEPTPETPPPPVETTPPPAETPTTPAETPTGEPTPGNTPGSGSNQSGGGSTPSTAKALTSEADPVDDLGPTIDGKTVKVCQASGSGTFTTGNVSAASVLDGSGIGRSDIVKPFTYSGGGFGGQNWDTGKSIYNNACTAPTDGSAPGGGTAAEACEASTDTEIVTPALAEGETTEGESAETPAVACEGVVALAVVKKVDICHARAAVTNPYGPKRINVSVQSIVNPNGHATHTGPVFPAANWGDIIPPFEHKDGSFPGLNWDDDGQAFWFNNCQEPGEPPPPGEEKVDICHADSNPQQPYGPGQINVSVNSILNQNGHAGHDAPVFFPGASDWGDIIPPFEHENGSFPGLNWDGDGQTIYFNNCQVPDEPGEEECPEESDDEESDEDGSGDVRALDDDKESDEECDEDEDEDGDDPDKAALLPDTGGTSLWTLLMGGMLTVLGLSILTNRESMGRIGLFGPVPSAAPAAAWSYTIGRDADLPVTVVKPESHRGRWTALGAAALVGVAILGRRGKDRRMWSVVRRHHVAAGGQHFHLGVVGDELLDRVEHLDDVGAVGGDDARTDADSSVLVQVVRLGSGDLEATSKLGDDRPHDGALRLQRVHVTQTQVELDPADPHALPSQPPGARHPRRAV